MTDKLFKLLAFALKNVDSFDCVDFYENGRRNTWNDGESLCFENSGNFLVLQGSEGNEYFWPSDLARVKVDAAGEWFTVEVEKVDGTLVVVRGR